MNVSRAPWQVYVFVVALTVLALMGLYRVTELAVGGVVTPLGGP